MKKIQSLVLKLSILIFMFIGLSSPSLIYADNFSGSSSQVCQGVGTVNGSGGCSTTSTVNLEGIIKDVINILTIIVGIAAVIMIVIAGFRFVVSGGESQNVSGARNTIIYALVGLVVVALAQIIVHFVLNNVSGHI